MRLDSANLFERIKNDRYALLSAIVCVLLLILIVYSLYVRVRLYMLGLSLWNDEALLVESIVNRSLGEIFLLPQDAPRSEPLFYLLAVKIISLLFGTSESALRSFSFFALIAMLIAQYVLLRKAFKVRIMYTLFSLAVTSTLLYYIQYSNELKPYMGDAAFVLIVLMCYYFYRNGNLGQGIRSAVILALLLVICFLFSSPAAFAAGAVFIVELIDKCVRKNRAGALAVVTGGVIFIAAFVLYYFYWLRPVSTLPDMVWFWIYRVFDFTSFSREALSHNLTLLQELLEPVWHAAMITIPLAVSGFIISLAKRNIYTAAVGVFFILLLVASELGKYPVQNRIWMFLFVIIFIYVYIFIDSLRVAIAEGKAAKAVRTFIPLGLAALLLIPNMSFPAYGRGEEWTVIPGNQANPIIEYVEENIKEGEYFYAYYTTDVINNVLRYKIGYDTHRIGNVSSDNIIFGTENIYSDIELITRTGGSYVFLYHAYYPLSQDTYKRRLTSILYERGYMEQIMNVNHTYLYWFTDDISRVRASAALEIIDLIIDGGSITGIARVDNTGGTIIAPENPVGYPDRSDGPDWDDFGRLFVVLYKADSTDGIVIGEFSSPVLRGESAETILAVSGLEPGEYRIELVSYGLYSFSELGTPAVPVVIR